MSFVFKQQSGIEEQVRSIASEQIVKSMRECEQVELEFDVLVHGLRRRCKKLRGLVRLIAPHFKTSKVEDRAFRDAARVLSGTRDAAVMVETCTSVLAYDRKRGTAAQIGSSEGAALLAQLRRGVVGGLDATRRSEMLGGFATIFEDAAQRVPQWSLSERGFDQIGDGLEDTYRQMRNGLEAVAAAPDASALHDWRKHAKYHWHHLTLMLDAAPDVLQPRKLAVGELAEMLGDHHNLAVLDDHVASNVDAEDDHVISAVRGLIAELQAHLADGAFDLGRQLVAEKPAMLRERFEQYWSLLPKKD